MRDFLTSRAGDNVIFVPLTNRAAKWLDDNVPADMIISGYGARVPYDLSIDVRSAAHCDGLCFDGTESTCLTCTKENTHI